MDSVRTKMWVKTRRSTWRQVPTSRSHWSSIWSSSSLCVARGAAITCSKGLAICQFSCPISVVVMGSAKLKWWCLINHCARVFAMDSTFYCSIGSRGSYSESVEFEHPLVLTFSPASRELHACVGVRMHCLPFFAAHATRMHSMYCGRS
jgi:hypothetical protein